MSRMSELRQRRAMLLERCARERLELQQQLERLKEQLPFAGALGPVGGLSARLLRQPLVWLALLGGLIFAGRTRRMLSLVVFARSALSMAARGALLLRVINEWRSARRGAAVAPAAAPTEDPSVRL